MNFKKGIISKCTCLTMTTALMLGAAPQLTYAQGFIHNTDIEASTNTIIEERLIFSDDFEDGLRQWIISNPDTNNPRIEVDANGNHFLRAEEGERASKTMHFKPNTTYRIYLDLAGRPESVVRVYELIPGEHPVDIHEARFLHPNMSPNLIEFTTGDDVNGQYTYLSLESQGAPGESWAHFDNIRVYELIEIEQPNLILNGDFSEGLNHWVGKAEISNISGVNHATVRNGAPISQAVRLQQLQEYTLTFNALQGTTPVNGVVTILGLSDNAPSSFEVLAHEEFSNTRMWESPVLNFNTGDNDGVIVLILPNLNSEYTVTNIRLVERHGLK